MSKDSFSFICSLYAMCVWQVCGTLMCDLEHDLGCEKGKGESGEGLLIEKPSPAAPTHLLIMI